MERNIGRIMTSGTEEYNYEGLEKDLAAINAVLKLKIEDLKRRVLTKYKKQIEEILR